VATPTVAKETAHARAAERKNHMWVHSSSIDRYLSRTSPVGAEVQDRCGTGSSTGVL
jgi:hypothetical protein